MGNQGIFIKAFIITAIVFGIGLYLGLQFSSAESDQLKQELVAQQAQFSESRNTLLFFQTFQDTPGFCDSAPATVEPIVQNARTLGDNINALEKTQPYESVLELKKQYTTLLAEEWLYVVQLKKACPEKRFQTVLFFYTNKPGDCPQCKEQGSILWNIQKESNNRLWVFSFEYNLDFGIVNATKKQFSVTKPLTIIVDENTVIEGFKTKAELEPYFAA